MSKASDELGRTVVREAASLGFLGKSQSTVRFVAWNLAHQCQERPIKDHFVEAVAALSPDILTLNEYVHGPSRATIVAALSASGLTHVEVSERVGTNNQVLIASRWPLDRGDLHGPSTADGGGESNFIHVIVRSADIELVALRAPAYERSAELRDYWEKLASIVRASAGRRIIFVGDLNADPERRKHLGASYLRQLRSDGWNIPNPWGAWSFVSGTRIDHAIASSKIAGIRAAYISSVNGLDLASRDKATRISDHAPLLVDMTLDSLRL